VPKPVASLTGVTQVSAGLAHACAVNGAGAVYCWGDNNFAQIGQGTTSNQPVNVPVVVPMPGAKKATQVSCANYHSCALMTDGSVACWGRNNSGQSGGFNGDAGDAATNPLPVSTAVEMKLSGKALAVGAGGADGNTPTGYACALIEGGSVQCWGYNADGELGRADAGSQNCTGGPCIVTPGNVSFP
jgi:alpha-tubulin suppressor-like RCC1 family protein